MLGFFEVDINSTEKQTFVVDKPRKPSFWGSRLDGQIHWIVHLCFDNVDTLERLPDHLNALIKTSLTIGGESYVFETDSVLKNTAKKYSNPYLLISTGDWS